MKEARWLSVLYPNRPLIEVKDSTKFRFHRHTPVLRGAGNDESSRVFSRIFTAIRTHPSEFPLVSCYAFKLLYFANSNRYSRPKSDTLSEFHGRRVFPVKRPACSEEIDGQKLWWLCLRWRAVDGNIYEVAPVVEDNSTQSTRMILTKHYRQQ